MGVWLVQRAGLSQPPEVCRTRSGTSQVKLKVVPDDGVCAVAARYGGGLLPGRPQDLQRCVDVHFCGVLNGKLHHLRGDQRRFALRVVCQ